MKRKFVLPVVCMMIIAACNNSSNESSVQPDTTAAENHDSMHQMTDANATVSPLPPIPDGAKVVFKNLKDGASVTSPLKVEMGTEAIRVDTAGPVVTGSGHHHLFIDAEDSLAAGTVIPKDSAHLHFGKGQTETEVKLTPGKHKLTLQFADGLHRSYGSTLSSVITVEVKK